MSAFLEHCLEYKYNTPLFQGIEVGHKKPITFNMVNSDSQGQSGSNASKSLFGGSYSKNPSGDGSAKNPSSEDSAKSPPSKTSRSTSSLTDADRKYVKDLIARSGIKADHTLINQKHELGKKSTVSILNCQKR